MGVVGGWWVGGGGSHLVQVIRSYQFQWNHVHKFCAVSCFIRHEIHVLYMYG